MKIHEPLAPNPASRPTPTQPSAKKSGGPASREFVDVSNAAQLIQEARRPEIPDQARVARLKHAIESGSLVVDPERIAEIILQEEG